MAEAATKLPIKSQDKIPERPAALGEWRPFEALRREMDRWLEDMDWRGPMRRAAFDADPFWRRELAWSHTPAVDVVEKDKAYEVTAELPGLDEKNVEVKVANGMLTIKGEKTQEKEEKRKDFYLSERRFGAFERRFQIPQGVDTSKIDASFRKGVLTVTLPKTQEAQAAEKTIAVKAG